MLLAFLLLCWTVVPMQASDVYVYILVGGDVASSTEAHNSAALHNCAAAAAADLFGRFRRHVWRVRELHFSI